MRPRHVNKAFAAIIRRSKAISHTMERAIDREPANSPAVVRSYLASPQHQRVRRDLKALRRRLITPLLRRTRNK